MSTTRNAKVVTILVVDDSRISRLLTRQFVLDTHTGWIVEEATTGEEALQKLETLIPDLIILDVNMPGMGGLAAVQKLREKCPSVKITLLTANVQDATRNKAAALGCGFAEKPITEDLIKQIISVVESV